MRSLIERELISTLGQSQQRKFSTSSGYMNNQEKG